jgi:hypothetical protein
MRVIVAKWCLLVAILVTIVGCSSQEAQFISECKQTVLDQLVSPGSARFLDDPFVRILPDGRAGMSLKVDAQNAHGGLLRGRFICLRHVERKMPDGTATRYDRTIAFGDKVSDNESLDEIAIRIWALRTFNEIIEAGRKRG